MYVSANTKINSAIPTMPITLWLHALNLAGDFARDGIRATNSVQMHVENAHSKSPTLNSLVDT